ncbi:hypothetical protein AB0C02_01745 [Micromonospora sp. NPDC048999]|uniref:hypothetical protein n=1 Tax=Micromonospora sp. NPDC048999 TaxID=3155391 RepID=UPI0034069FEE
MEETPPWNDPQIPDSEWLYRRVPRRPDFFQQKDVLDSKPVIGRNAFRFDGDGMSVYRHLLCVQHGLTPKQVRRNDGYVLFKIGVGAVRALKAGVIDEEDKEDPEIGVAHALVRVEGVIKPAKEQRREIQLGLIEAAQYIDLDGRS